MRNPRLTWLLNQIGEWQDAGIVSPYQAEAIRARYAPSGALGSRRGFHALIWSVLGVGVVCLSIVLAISHWWILFPLWARVLLASLPVAVSWILLTGVSRKWPFIEVISPKWLAPLNAGLLFVSMVILSNLYGWESGWVFLGVVALSVSAPLLFRFPSEWWVVFASVALNGLIWGADTVGLRAIIGCTAIAISLPLSIGLGRSPFDWTNRFVAWSLAIALTASVVGISESLHPTAFMLLPLVVWSMVLGMSNALPSEWILRKPIVLISAFGLFATLFLGGSNGIWNEWVGVSVVETSSYVLVLGALLGLAVAGLGSVKGSRLRWVLMLPPSLGLLGMIVHRFFPEWVFPSVFSAMAVGAAILSIRYGVSSAKRGWINSGVVALVLVILEKCVSSEWPIGVRLTFLGVAGVTLLGVGLYFNSKVVKR